VLLRCMYMSGGVYVYRRRVSRGIINTARLRRYDYASAVFASPCAADVSTAES
jgi:hypothetical protein